MTKGILNRTRRDVLRGGALGAAAVLADHAGLATKAFAADNSPEIIMDGHVHITNRIYWEGIDRVDADATGLGFRPGTRRWCQLHHR